MSDTAVATEGKNRLEEERQERLLSAKSKVEARGGESEGGASEEKVQGEPKEEVENESQVGNGIAEEAAEPLGEVLVAGSDDIERGLVESCGTKDVIGESGDPEGDFNRDTEGANTGKVAPKVDGKKIGEALMKRVEQGKDVESKKEAVREFTSQDEEGTNALRPVIEKHPRFETILIYAVLGEIHRNHPVSKGLHEVSEEEAV
ncbi:hypothetical protein TrRE_jg11637, partial [Triparma retinervis]